MVKLLTKSLNYNNTGKEKELKYQIERTGLASVKLSKNNIVKNCMVARLVAETFIPNTHHKPQVMHISKNITDNRVENLKWAYICEVKFNTYKKGARKIGTASNNKISYKGKKYKSYSQLAKDYNISGNILDKRLRNGWTLQESLEIPINRKEFMLRKKLYEYKGKLYSIKQLSELARMSERTLYKRLRRGWSVEEAVEIPLCKNRKVV